MPLPFLHMSRLFAHHLAGVRWLLRAKRALQLTPLCDFIEFVLAALAWVWGARFGVWHTLSSLAFAALAERAVGLWAGLPALASPWVALVLQQTFNNCNTPSTKSSVKQYVALDQERI
jgi:hypothetical protein